MKACGIWKKFTRVGAVSLTALFVAAVIPFTAAAAELPFEDVPPGSWFEPAVSHVYEKGLFNGNSATAFAPDAAMTRAMFVQVLYNHCSTKELGERALEFTDVQSSDWYYAPVMWAASHEIVNGTSPTTFGPNQKVTREQMAVMLYNYLKVTRNDISFSADGKDTAFPDYNQVNGYATEAIAWAANSGILNGSSGYLQPGKNSTRAEVAQMFTNADSKLASDRIPVKVWVVDVPGHYETVTEEKQVWVEEVGHWEQLCEGTDGWAFRCNQCGAVRSTDVEINKHLDDSWDWDTMTGCASYTKVSAKDWVVDTPAHFETVTEERQEWVEEVGHWEYQ